MKMKMEMKMDLNVYFIVCNFVFEKTFVSMVLN